MATCCNKFVFNEVPDTFQMWQGLRGPYFTPHVAENGDLSWSNNGQLPNPETVNIKGPPGPGGIPGGTTGQLLAKASDQNYDTEWIDPPDLDAGHVEYDPTETYDDGSVGKELTTINSALTSLSSVTEIIDTASGAIASFPDGAGLPMRSLVAQINPVQEGTGDPSPDNIRPISGHTGLSVEVRGKNLFEPLSDAYYKVESGKSFNGYNITSLVSFLNTLPVGDYIVSFKFNVLETVTGATTWGILLRNSVTGYIDGRQTGQHNSGETLTFSRSITITEANKGQFVNAYLYSGGGNKAKVYWYDFLLEVGSSASSYEPYTSGATTTVSWQDEAGTVYGGSDEVVGGSLTSTMASVDMGDLSWTYDSANTRFMTASLANVINKGASGWVDWLLCSAYKSTAGTSADKCVSYYAPTGYVVARDTSYTDATAFKNAVTGVQLVYPLATPQTFALTPAQISTLLGQNNVWHDANGDATVTYQASIKGYIDKVLAS